VASNFEVGLIHSPTGTDWAIAATKDKRHDWQNFQSPAVHGGVAHENATLLHLFLQMAKAQGVSCIPTGAHQQHFEWIAPALEYRAQFGDHRGFDHVFRTGIVMFQRLPRQGPVEGNEARGTLAAGTAWQVKRVDPELQMLDDTIEELRLFGGEDAPKSIAEGLKLRERYVLKLAR
jgi:hypothetical protein